MVDIDVQLPRAVFFPAELIEEKLNEAANVNKQTLRFAAYAFLAAFIISLIQSLSAVSIVQVAVELDVAYAVLLICIIVIITVSLIVTRAIPKLFEAYQNAYKRKLNQIILPWIWYNLKKGVTYDSVMEGNYITGNIDGEPVAVLLAEVCFKVPPNIKKTHKPKEEITIEKVKGELKASDKSMVEVVDKAGQHIRTDRLSDESAKLLKQTYESQRNDEHHEIEIGALFRDRKTGKFARWLLHNIVLSSEKSSKTFSFSASAQKKEY